MAAAATACRPGARTAEPSGRDSRDGVASERISWRLNASAEKSLLPARAVACDVAAHASMRVPYEAVGGLRRQPGPRYGEPFPVSFLKHADEQTVVGLSALFQAIHDHGLTPAPGSPGFRDWGVVAAPRFLGRATMAAALQRFTAEGAWGVSPHLIPHHSLHSMSGTVSQALKLHGPNFGVGGGPGAAAEGILAAAALLECRRLPGVWLVLTGIDPEQAPDTMGRPAPGTSCAALVLALVPPRPGWSGIRLRVISGAGPAACGEAPCSAGGSTGIDLFRLTEMLALLDRPCPGATTLIHLLDEAQGPGTRIELSRGPAEPGDKGTRWQGDKVNQTANSATEAGPSPSTLSPCHLVSLSPGRHQAEVER
jgi:hypothetical protein